MEACPYSGDSPLASVAPIGPRVARIELDESPPLWDWLDCHDAPLADATTRFPNRLTWRDPPVGQLCCARRCFRAVMDDAIEIPRFNFTKGQRARCRDSKVRPSPSAGWELGRVASVAPLRVRLVSSSERRGRIWDEVRPVGDGGGAIDDDVHARAMVEAIRRLLVKEAGLRDADVVASRWQRQSTRGAADFTERYAWHCDYAQHPGGVYSAILYTAHDDEEPLVGGHTAFVDTPPPRPEGDPVGADAAPGLERLANGSAYLRRGLSVAPRVGRLLLFSGGAENYHAPMPVASGRRQSLLAWFSCGCEEPSRDTHLRTLTHDYARARGEAHNREEGARSS